uniref:Uncharacterized protein n=1 Tax=Pyxicephalus adspersus TaxID=30357 RepID=A0AAV3A1D3_PYXAD|nr:TPA: hypothetical protein GDO54_017143 [Pyxicephalus adspersus]
MELWAHLPHLGNFRRHVIFLENVFGPYCSSYILCGSDTFLSFFIFFSCQTFQFYRCHKSAFVRLGWIPEYNTLTPISYRGIPGVPRGHVT